MESFMRCSGYPLGFHKVFPVTFEANLGGSVKGGRVLLPLQGDGKLSFFFAATHDPDVLAVYVEDVALLLRPFSVKMPGHQEPVEIPQTFLGRHVFDLNACHGLLHPKTHQLTLNLSLTLTHEVFPQLAMGGVEAPVSIRIVEKGHLDFEKETIETHATSFDVSGGLMHALVVHPGTRDERSALQFRNSFGPPNDSSMKAEGVVGATDEGGCFEHGAPAILVCPGHAVTLCWRSSGKSPNFSTPVQTPKNISSKGSFTVNPTVSTKFHFDVESTQNSKSGKPYHSSADVDVQVVTQGMVWPMTFSANSATGLWEQNISKFQVDPNIMVDTMIIVPCGNQQVLFDQLTGTWVNSEQSPEHSSFSINAKDATPIGVPLVGLWQFNYYGKAEGTVCVNAFIRCTG
jgi:hypothetical protein